MSFVQDKVWQFQISYYIQNMRGFQPFLFGRTQCGLLSPQSLTNFAEIRFRSAIVPG
jgi:hypothetical protein